MLKKIIIAISLVAALTVAVAIRAGELADNAGNDAGKTAKGKSAARSATAYADESQLSEIICLEAKAGAGEAIATIEAVDEALDGIFSKINSLGIVLEKPDCQSKAQDLVNRIEDICRSARLEEREEKMSALAESIAPLKYAIRTELQEKLNGTVEPELKKKAEELKIKARERLAGEGKALALAAEEKLKKEAEAEAASLKGELEARLKGEAEDELKRRAENGEYGDVPDQAGLRSAGEKIMDEMADQEEKKSQAGLTAKYERLAEEERAKIWSLIEEKAGGEEKLYEEIRNDFLGLQSRIMELKTAKYKEKWESYNERSSKEKSALIQELLDKQISAAKKIILDNAKDMEAARSEGKLAGFEYKSADDLAGGLEKDKVALITALADSGSPREAMKKRDEFALKWQNAKNILEASKIKAKDDILDKIEKDAKPAELKGRISRSKSHFESVVANYLKRRQYCESNPKVNTPSKPSQISACAFCRSMKEYEIQAQFAQNAGAQYELALNSIEELNSWKGKGPKTVDEALKFKDKFVENIKPLAGLEMEYEPIFRSYESALKQNRETCLSYINK